MRALTHLFGSTDGYRTLARSPGIQEEDEAVLAALGFGSPRTDEEFESLDRTPCIAGRVLPGGLYAITRVFAGAPDVAGRRTAERRTLLLLAPQWQELVCGDLRATLEDPRNWDREPFMAGESIEVTVHPRRKAPLQPTEADRRVYDGLLAARDSRRCATFESSETWSDAVLRLPALMPPTEALLIGWGVGLWAIPNFVSVATVRADVGARGFHAATSGPFRHPEVLKLGGPYEPLLTFVPHGEPMPWERPRRPIRRLVPGIAAALVMLAASTLIVAAVMGRRAPVASRVTQSSETDSREPTAPAPSESTTEQPVRAEPPPQTVAESAPRPAPPSGATTGTATHPPLPQLVPESSSHATQSTTAAQTDTREAFGSGTSEPMRDMRGDPSAPEAPVERSPAPAPAPAPTKDPGAAPAAAPSIPPPPADSTPWDIHVTLLRKATDLHAEATAANSKEAGAALVPKLGAHADALVRAHRELEKSARTAASSERLLIRIDAVRGKRGLTELVSRAQLAQTFPPLLIQRMLLLSGRFEISLAVQDLVRRQQIDTGALPKELKADVKADGWPDEGPWVYWYARDRGAPLSSAIDGARYMADQFDRSLTGHPGTRNAQQALEAIVNRAMPEAHP